MQPGSFVPVSLILLGVIGGAVLTQQLLPRVRVQQAAPPRLTLNQYIIEDSHRTALDVNDPRAVFAYVFSQLPEQVKVYPTENYYYFRFYAGGQEINGNLRLDPADRAQGIVNFGYFSSHHHPTRPEDLDFLSEFIQLTESDGVRLSKENDLAYTIAYNNKSVRFELNDLPQTLPAGMPLRSEEQFIARTFDESGFQFALLYDAEKPQFRFILDETAPLPDILSQVDEALTTGRLSGFVFYQDELNRKILIGVAADNIRRNNYYDGPFDQLADNFTAGETLKRAMEAAYPYTRGQIDERGVFLNASGERSGSRLAITPYATYEELKQLQQFVDRCQAADDAAEAIRCLTFDYKQGANP